MITMLYGNKACCLRNNEIAILRRTWRRMLRLMCGVKLKEPKKTGDLMGALELQDSVDTLEKVSQV